MLKFPAGFGMLIFDTDFDVDFNVEDEFSVSSFFFGRGTSFQRKASAKPPNK